MDDLIKKLLSLPESDRVRIVEVLLASMSHSPVSDDAAVTEEEKRMLDERMSEFKKNPETAVPWEEAMGILKKSLEDFKRGTK